MLNQESTQDTSVEPRRTGGMIVVAVFNMIFGCIGILNGLLLVAVMVTLMRELSRLGVPGIQIVRSAFAIVALATGILGLIAGIGVTLLRPWGRTLSLTYGGLLIVIGVLSFFLVPLIASIGTNGLHTVDTTGLVRLIVFGAIYIGLPVIYAPLLLIAFNRPAWKAAFAKGDAG
jgi:hypothetical protein